MKMDFGNTARSSILLSTNAGNAHADDKNEILAAEQFSELNSVFMRTCIENVQISGQNCWLGPVLVDYLAHSNKLLLDAGVGLLHESTVSAIEEIGASLKAIAEDFIKLAKVNRNKMDTTCGDVNPPAKVETMPIKISAEVPAQKLPSPNPKLPSPNPKLPLFSGFAAPTPAVTPVVSSSPATAEEDLDEASEKAALAHEFVPVTEDEAIFSTRCKVFHKVAHQFESRGIGQLYVQKTDDGSHRILVRADNSMGNILLNMKLTSDIPLSLNLEKKQVITIDPHKPCPISFMVKTTDQAQDLFDVMDKCQKALH